MCATFPWLLYRMLLTFSLHAFRFEFLAIDSVHFPMGKAGNIFRGAFGSLFRSIACVPNCPGARTCPDRSGCPYARMFEPALVEGPSGLANPPRPFVFRAHHLDGRVVGPGQRFHVDVHVFDIENSALPFFVLTFARLATQGLGPRRGRVQLIRVQSLNSERKIDAELLQVSEFRVLEPPPPIRLSLSGDGCKIHDMEILFETPTEVKGLGAMRDDLPFGVLFARIRDRISTLRALYGEGPLPIDFRQLGDEAAIIQTLRVDIRPISVERRSSRTGHRHGVGGVLGTVSYRGDLGRFLPYIRVAEWTGVGRHTAFGSGVLSVRLKG